MNGHSEWLVSSEACDFKKKKKHVAFGFPSLHLPPLAVKSGLERGQELKKKSSLTLDRMSYCFLGRIKMHKGKKEPALLHVSLLTLGNLDSTENP